MYHREEGGGCKQWIIHSFGKKNTFCKTSAKTHAQLWPQRLSLGEHNTFTQCCLLFGQRRRRWANNNTTLVECLFARFILRLNMNVSDTRYYASVVSMLTHRLRRWPNIESTLGERFVFAGHLLVENIHAAGVGDGATLATPRPNASDNVPTLRQRWIDDVWFVWWSVFFQVMKRDKWNEINRALGPLCALIG